MKILCIIFNYNAKKNIFYKMKFLKKFSEHKYFENYILDFTNTPNISKCILEGEIHYQKKITSTL